VDQSYPVPSARRRRAGARSRAGTGIPGPVRSRPKRAEPGPRGTVADPSRVRHEYGEEPCPGAREANASRVVHGPARSPAIAALPGGGTASCPPTFPRRPARGCPPGAHLSCGGCPGDSAPAMSPGSSGSSGPSREAVRRRVPPVDVRRGRGADTRTRGEWAAGGLIAWGARCRAASATRLARSACRSLLSSSARADAPGSAPERGRASSQRSRASALPSRAPSASASRSRSRLFRPGQRQTFSTSGRIASGVISALRSLPSSSASIRSAHEIGGRSSSSRSGRP
jgi:hypothetical protein